MFSSYDIKCDDIQTASGSHDNKAYLPSNDDPEELQLTNAKSAKSIDRKRKRDWKDIIKNKVFICTWLPFYDKETGISDLIAGITLGLTLIPQSIAYASLANLPSQYGLYAAFMGSIVYIFFGTVKEVSIGPTSLMALLTLQYTIGKPPEFAVILGFLSGCIELCMGLFRLGFIVEFISIPVTSAFTSATSLIIIGAQLKNLFGISYKSKGFADSIIYFFQRIGNVEFGDITLSICCCIFLLAFRSLKDLKVHNQHGKKAIWYLSLSRNAMIVLFTAIVAYFWVGEVPFKLSGKVEPGIPTFEIPPFSITHGNTTYNFVDICYELGSGIIVVPLVAVLANVAIAKSFASGKTIDATQEMLTLGVCNIIGGCFKSMPTCGAFTRSAVSHASGVRTPLSGLYSASITLLSLSLLTPYFYYIPKATLAAVLCCAVFFMIDYELPKTLWKQNKLDFCTWLMCLLICLAIGVELGLLFGIVFNSLYLLYIWARPRLQININSIRNIEFLEIIPNSGLFFPAIGYMRSEINSANEVTGHHLPIVIHCNRFIGFDYTTIHGLKHLAMELEKQKQMLILLQLHPSQQKFFEQTLSFKICHNVCSLEETLRLHNYTNVEEKTDYHVTVIENMDHEMKSVENKNN